MIETDGSWIYAVLGMTLGVLAFCLGWVGGAIWAWWKWSQ